MGNSNGKKALTGGDLEFLREHTSITHDDQAMYENFIYVYKLKTTSYNQSQ